MTKNLDTRKYKLIKAIMSLSDEDAISAMEHQVSLIKDKPDFWEAIKPIKKTYSLEQMIKDQNYQPISKEDFFQLTSELGIDEPLEDLLEMLD